MGLSILLETIGINPMLTFDDFRIVPRTPSYVESRRTVDTSVALTGLSLAVPVIVPGMKSLVTQALIDNVEAAGGAVAQPRNVIFRAGRPIINVSMNQAENVAASLHGRSILSIEIANGHMSKLGNLVESIKRAHPDRIVWAGTVADARGAKFLAEGGADAIIVGIGVGQACTTTDKTGVGLPLVESLIDIYKSGIQVPIITSGGLRKPADFVKAIALGADACMTGSLVAGCLDTAEAP